MRHLVRRCMECRLLPPLSQFEGAMGLRTTVIFLDLLRHLPTRLLARYLADEINRCAVL